MEVRPLEGSTHVFSGINVASDADIRERLSSYGEPVKHLSYGEPGQHIVTVTYCQLVSS